MEWNSRTDILINKRIQSSVICVQSYRQAHCSMGYYTAVAKLRKRLRKKKYGWVILRIVYQSNEKIYYDLLLGTV
jgi:hypothetical protein